MLTWEFHKGNSIFFIDQLDSTDQDAETRRGKVAFQGHWVHRNNGNVKQSLRAWMASSGLSTVLSFYWLSKMSLVTPHHWAVMALKDRWITFLPAALAQMTHFLQIPFFHLLDDFFLSWLSYKRYRIKNSHPWPTIVMTMIRYTLSVTKWLPLPMGDP